MHIIIGFAALMALSWLVSTPQSRAAVAPAVDRFSRGFFYAVMALVAFGVLYSWLVPPGD